MLKELRHAARSLVRVRGLSLTVMLTLALGIGANAAIFTVVQGVLLRPLANQDEDRLIYIRQSAPGLKVENANFSVPELRDLQASVKSVAAFGDFSTLEFTLVGLGEPRVVRAGVVGGSYFGVMGLRPVAGRLLGPSDDGPSAAGAVVLTHRFWTSALKADETVIGKTIRLGDRAATIVGVLEQVRKTGTPELLAGRAGVVPDVHRYHRHGVVLVQDDRQAVRQLEHLVGGRHLGLLRREGRHRQQGGQGQD